MADESGVTLVRDGSVATITMTSAALTTRVKTDLADAVTEVGQDSSVRAVVLTGSGKAFSVGQDLKEHAQALHADAATALDTVKQHYNPIVLGLVSMPKPVIASINGLCVGAGLGFALACDLRIASSAAKFGTAFTAIGLSTDSGLSVTLARAVGAARASELVLRANTFSAADALNWGIVGQLAEPDDLAAETAELARKFADGPTLAYAEAKAAMAVSLRQALEIEAAGQTRLGVTVDHRNAVDAFLAKEVPKFEGR
ncbi:enoyl-CoA hydratase/isomerase family protein [Kibdelosporangium phytohabitans]|uniref:Enoyl-CoA hydratase n=1 Tax=Kibdelosporangium phytohabitans TaxID=860235 RepID=A0A0N9HUE3_9PSEU|nr:enoyl-CoA hydratase-related protein [Kibdelosporangium phytohabitans]ALG07123.1 enoyl-CoA hydratase [Kibdelosporangium phytohabitans]MBE1468444.1 2-(1,2-epoxy-1,2-dihydrophenyl)acetyl-CoA isomerase [Kibdelosporangium phytohabitans]